MEHDDRTAQRDCGVPAIIAALEEQLAILDRQQAWIAAAHLDNAIQHLRLTQARR